MGTSFSVTYVVLSSMKIEKAWFQSQTQNQSPHTSREASFSTSESAIFGKYACSACENHEPRQRWPDPSRHRNIICHNTVVIPQLVLQIRDILGKYANRASGGRTRDDFEGNDCTRYNTVTLLAIIQL
jgi:hypothetical protein